MDQGLWDNFNACMRRAKKWSEAMPEGMTMCVKVHGVDDAEWWVHFLDKYVPESEYRQGDLMGDITGNGFASPREAYEYAKKVTRLHPMWRAQESLTMWNSQGG